MENCAICDTVLDQDLNCPNGCTEDKMYAVALAVVEGADMYDGFEIDVLKMSIEAGHCDHCGSKMMKHLCPLGCFEEGMLSDPDVQDFIRYLK
jgi:hypothetical protein